MNDDVEATREPAPAAPPDDPAGDEERSQGSAPAWRKALYLLGGVAVVGALWFGGRQLGGSVLDFAEWVRGLGVWGPLAYILGYAVAAVAFVPGSLLTLASGVIFGLLWGTVYTLIGASLGACAAFLVGRYVARGAVERRIQGNPRFAAIDRAVGREGLKIVALLRLSPIFPFNLLNYGLGLTKVKFWHYAVACLAMLPGTFLYVYYGKLAGSLVAVASGEVERGPGQWVLLGVGIVATLAVTWVITRQAQRALQRETDIDIEEVADDE